MGDDYDEEEYFICRKCKSKSEKVFNEKTNKPYTLCENCRSKCRSKGNKKMRKVKICQIGKKEVLK